MIDWGFLQFMLRKMGRAVDFLAYVVHFDS